MGFCMGNLMCLMGKRKVVKKCKIYNVKFIMWVHCKAAACCFPVLQRQGLLCSEKREITAFPLNF